MDNRSTQCNFYSKLDHFEYQVTDIPSKKETHNAYINLSKSDNFFQHLATFIFCNDMLYKLPSSYIVLVVFYVKNVKLAVSQK